MIIKILCALLIIAGFFLLLGLHPYDVSEKLFKPVLRRRSKKQRIRYITRKPKGRLEATRDNAKDMLAAANMGDRKSVV